jgi:hypothetical protein
MEQQNALHSYLIQTKLSFFKNREWEGKTSLVWGVGTSGREEDMRKGCKGQKW